VIGGPSNAHPPPAEGPAQIRYTCCTSISRWVVAILGGGPLFGTDHARCCSSALDAAADTPRYADPLWSGLKTDSLRHFTGKESEPNGPRGAGTSPCSAFERLPVAAADAGEIIPLRISVIHGCEPQKPGPIIRSTWDNQSAANAAIYLSGAAVWHRTLSAGY